MSSEDTSDRDLSIGAPEDAKQDLRPDWLLEMLIDIAEGGGIGITLNCGGTIVSGVICSGSEYLESVGNALNQGSSNVEDGSTAIVDSFRRLAESVYPPDRSDQDRPPRTFIHLRDAHLFVGRDQIPTSEVGPYWRGRLEGVDGWLLGVLSQP